MRTPTKNDIRRAVGSTVLILLFALTPHAQSPQLAGPKTQGRLAGLVLDSNKARIASARILVEGAGIRNELVAREDGAYELNLPAGDYVVTVSCDGFRTHRVINVRIRLQQSTTLDVTLETADVIPEFQISEPEIESETSLPNNSIEPRKPANQILVGCLSYEPAIVSLNGIIMRHIFPGPPNFESVAKGDQPEQIWVLHLSRPICVSASSDFEAQSNISDFQLVLREGQKEYDRYRSLLGKRVEVTGTLFQASTGHHHTKVLLTVSGIERR